MIISQDYSASSSSDAERADARARAALARRATALGAILTPDDVTATTHTAAKGLTRRYRAEISPVPYQALEAAGRAYYGRMEAHERSRAKRDGTPLHWTPWEQLDRFHKATVIREAQQIAEAAYPVTRAQWLRDAADEIRDETTTNGDPAGLVVTWTNDAQILDGLV